MGQPLPAQQQQTGKRGSRVVHDDQVTFRCSSRKLLLYRAAAGVDCVSLADWLRRAADAYLERYSFEEVSVGDADTDIPE